MELSAFFISVLLTLISSAFSAPLDNKICIANYLKKKGLLNDKYGNGDEVGAACLDSIKNLETLTLLEVRKKLGETADLKNNIDCMIQELEKTDFVDHVLKSQVLDSKNDKVSQDEKRKELNETLHRITKLSGDAIIDCQFSSEFGTIFDTILESDSTEEEDITEEEDYCIRKHILENDLIDKTKYDLKENPNGIDTTNIDCEKVYKEVEAKIKDHMVESMKEIEIQEDTSKYISEECVMDVLDSKNIIDKLAYIDYLPELVEKDAELSHERESFISLMKELTKTVLNQCLKLK